MGADKLFASEAKSLIMTEDIIYFPESGVENECVHRVNRYPKDDNSADKVFNCRNGEKEHSRCHSYHDSGDNVLNCPNTETGSVDGPGLQNNGDIDTEGQTCNCSANVSGMVPICEHTNRRHRRYHSLRNTETCAHIYSTINTNCYKFQHKCEKCGYLNSGRNGLLQTATLNAVGSVDGREVTARRHKRSFGLMDVQRVLFLHFLLFQSVL